MPQDDDLISGMKNESDIMTESINQLNANGTHYGFRSNDDVASSSIRMARMAAVCTR